MRCGILGTAICAALLGGIGTASAQTYYVEQGYAPAPVYAAPAPAYAAPAPMYSAPPAGYVVAQPGYAPGYAPGYVMQYSAPAYVRPPLPIPVAPHYGYDPSGLSYANSVAEPACGWDECD